MNSYLRETYILHCSQLPCEQSEPGTTHIYRQDTGWNRWVHVLHCNWKRGEECKSKLNKKSRLHCTLIIAVKAAGPQCG